jgi:hypothetical protein
MRLNATPIRRVACQDLLLEEAGADAVGDAVEIE